MSDSGLYNATKQFRHYLLGRPFQLYTDHAPLRGLSGQKMVVMLCSWALALQEFDFTINYKPGVQNVNADALSCCNLAHNSCTANLRSSAIGLARGDSFSTRTRSHHHWAPPTVVRMKNRARPEYLKAVRNVPISSVLVTIGNCWGNCLQTISARPYNGLSHFSSPASQSTSGCIVSGTWCTQCTRSPGDSKDLAQTVRGKKHIE